MKSSNNAAITMPSVFIIEDEKYTRALLCKVINEHPKMTLLVAASDLTSARLSLQQYGEPDLFLVDLGLPDGNGITFIKEVRQQFLATTVMVLSTFGDERNVVQAIAAGAGGYIHKDEDLQNIGCHIEQALAGNAPISPSIAKHIIHRMQAKETPCDGKKTMLLSQRELDVLHILKRGFSRIEVANHLHISPHTVTSHIKNIYKKLNVHSRTEAVFEAQQLGLMRYLD